MTTTATALAADDAFFTALLTADGRALDALLADDFSLVDVMAGQLVPRDAFLGLVGGGDLEFLKVDRDATDVAVRERPGLSVITGRTRMTMRFQGEEVTAASRYTHVFVKDGGNWRLLAAQGTPEVA
ncbi:nuclear transport factor 2 family protein [Phytomonospora endophytica]|uniref:Ketosteroid isomerase-like protein n=1 Tax=Phytomonospora endophytica TaxID=714109 RepID=A0A841FM25_9ACTN|nr:nuclear transport factor 2 family protein [Phytomonospora endophytica]MBB6038371.1 ketosteroid isomerase-like protein [Phytomonospora endophytica]GIG64302.1 hypothetical protein Pen01_05970 [Phytomonospora endophytica]